MKKQSRTKNSILNLVTSVFGQFLIIALNFVTRTVFIKVLGKQYLGINGLFSDILSMLALTELGIDTAMNFKLYKPLAQGDEKRVRLLMKFYRNAYTVVGFVILTLGLGLIPFLHLFIKDYDSLGKLGINASLIFVMYLMQSVSSYFFFASRSAIVKADQKSYMLNVAGYVVTLATNLAQIAVLLISGDFILYTGCVIIFVIIKNFINAAIAKKYYPYAFKKEKDSLDKAEVKDIFKDLGALFVYKINSVVVKATDNMVLSTFIGLEIVGMYSNYLMIYFAVKSVVQKAYMAVKASMGNLFAVADTEEKYRFFEVMNFISALLYGTACVGIAVLANEFILLWIGESYVIPEPFSMLVGIETLFMGLKYNLGQVRNVTGVFRQMWFRPVIGIIVNIVASVGLVQVIGIYGVVMGTILSDIFSNFMVDPSVIHKYAFDNFRPVSEYYIRNAKYGAVLLVTGLADRFICMNLFTGHGIVSFAVHTLICGASVPAVFYLVFGRRHECIYLINIGKRLLKRKV